MMTKEYREEQEEKRKQEIKDREQKEYERWLKEKNKKPKMYGEGSKFTRPKKKRKR